MRFGQGAIGCEFGLEAGQLLQAVFERGQLVHVVVRGGDKVDQAQGGRLCPEIVNTNLAALRWRGSARHRRPPRTRPPLRRDRGAMRRGVAGGSCA